MRYLLLCPLLILIASCSGTPKTVKSEKLEVRSEQEPADLTAAASNEQAPTELPVAESIVTADLPDAVDSASELTEIPQPEPVPEESVLADADVEEKPTTEYVETLSMPEQAESSEIAGEPELQPTDEPSVIVMETLRPLESAPPSESAPSSESASLLEPVSPLESAPPSESAQEPPVPEQRTAQIVPPVREPWRPQSSPAEMPSLSETPPKESASLFETMPPAVTKKDEAPEVAREPPFFVYDQPDERDLQPDYPITFSRTARVTVGQLVEIPFMGRDWVFLGEVGARRGIAYDSRKLDTEGESFIFRVDAAGVYALKFYRQDFVHDLILNDHVQIIAGSAPQITGLAWFNPPIDRSRVVAGPRWPNFLEQQPVEVFKPEAPPIAVQPPVVVQPPVEAVRPATPPVTAQPSMTARPPATSQPPARQPSAARNEAPRPQGLSGNAVAQAAPVQPQAQPPSQPAEPPSPPAVEPVSPDVILKQAREEFNAGRIASAITLLDQFRKSFPSGSDEAWWLYGQCYEANSPNRNMLAALEYYRRIVREYPQSSRLSEARRRIAYLERYYINIQ